MIGRTALLATLFLAAPAFAQQHADAGGLPEEVAAPDAGLAGEAVDGGPEAAASEQAIPEAPAVEAERTETQVLERPPSDAAPSEAPAAPAEGEAATVAEAEGAGQPPVDPAAAQAAAEKKYSSVVVGTAETRTSGSVHVIKDRELQRFEYDDPHAVLRQVPGLYARGEDGFGLRPNIGLRGANSDRSKKVTLMEDGILFGPAPYSAPAAYYFPLVTRMMTVRVLKGPSAIMHGPQTVGGSVDFITRVFPYDETLLLDVAGGQYLYGKLHGVYGATMGRNAFLVEGVHNRTDGFKELDGGGDTGYVRNEFMFKGQRTLDPLGEAKQKVELKLGFSQEGSNETYLGLTDEDFRANPLRRYATSALDRMEWYRTQIVLRHALELGRLSVDTALYRQDFSRAWNKVNHFRGAGIANVLADPTSARNAIYYGVLSGKQDTSSNNETLFIGPNDRAFVSQGLQSTGQWSATTGPLLHQLEFGARWHYDRIERLHTEDGYRVEAGRLVHAGGPTVTTANNRDSTYALALHLVDAMSWGPVTVTPGLRTELIRSRSQDNLTGTVEHGSVNVLLPGVGAHWAILEQLGVFGGVYRGFSPPPPGQGDTALPEESINYEAGARWTPGGTRLEVVGFYNDYANLTDICTYSNGCLNDNLDRQFDAGNARIYGLEALASKNLRFGRKLTIPLSLAYTLTKTEFLESFQSADPQFGNVTAGDELPYVPLHQVYATAGVETKRFGIYLNALYVSQMREIAGQGEADAGELTDELLTFDASASVNLFGGKLYLNARNLTNNVVIVSRRPFGARPNAPRMVQLGFKYEL